MVEVGIPLYEGRATICNALDSLVAQTRKRFITCISIDGGDDDYSDIIEEYRHRGLNIRVIHPKENGGPGAARQRIIDTTQCDYIMFLDADDMLMPQAVNNLYNAIRYGNYDILRAGFIREENHKKDVIIPSDAGTITWTHGKIYKVSFLKRNNIHFLKDLRTDEDAHFNLVAWNCAQNRGQLDEILYLWRDNQNSLTRRDNNREYFSKTFLYYIYGQICGLNQIYEITHNITPSLITQTLVNIYTYYMQAKFYKINLSKADDIISTLRSTSWMKKYLIDGQNWIDLVNTVKPGTVIEDCVLFYKETINLWISRLLREENKSVQ